MRSSRALGPILLALAVAEAGVRLLKPRRVLIAPEPVDLRTYFSEAEITRGRKYARPQLALSLARSAVEGAALARLVRRPPRWLTPPASVPAPLAGALGAAALTTALSVPPLPLSVVSAAGRSGSGS